MTGLPHLGQPGEDHVDNLLAVHSQRGGLSKANIPEELPHHWILTGLVHEEGELTALVAAVLSNPIVPFILVGLQDRPVRGPEGKVMVVHLPRNDSLCIYSAFFCISYDDSKLQ